MARSSLNIDGAGLEALLGDLDRVRTDFETAVSSAQLTAEACGHARLAAKVTSFATNWNDRRAQLARQITELGEALSTIDQTFAEVDGELEGTLVGGDR
jgi:ABC-type transporter Mla subunit MlaD